MVRHSSNYSDIILVPIGDYSTIDRANGWEYPKKMPNPLRKLAEGDPLYTSIVDYFGDDVSGNRSKSWNKHWNGYMTHRSLPRRMLQQEFQTHFVSSSPHATIPEQFGKFKEVVESTHKKPVKTHDAATGESVRFRIAVNANPSDNPMQSESCSHVGSGGNLFCRKCKVGGTSREKETDEGFDSLFSPAEPRSKDGVISALQEQLSAACSGVAQHVKDLQTATGVKDSYTQYWIEQLLERARTMKNMGYTQQAIYDELKRWVEDNMSMLLNPFFTLDGFDPTKDTPIEILHTILLGIVKYAWHGTHTSWNNEAKKLYSIRLQATDVQGLSIPAIRANYIMQYAGSLIGRQFKTIVQTIAFDAYDLMPSSYFQLWLSVGELSALLWFPEISNQDEYLVSTY